MWQNKLTRTIRFCTASPDPFVQVPLAKPTMDLVEFEFMCLRLAAPDG
jgi:hypothetical protein